MSNWDVSNRVKLTYDDGDELSMYLSIITQDRKVYREDIEKVIEYLEEKKYDFEMNI